MRFILQHTRTLLLLRCVHVTEQWTSTCRQRAAAVAGILQLFLFFISAKKKTEQKSLLKFNKLTQKYEKLLNDET